MEAAKEAAVAETAAKLQSEYNDALADEHEAQSGRIASLGVEVGALQEVLSQDMRYKQASTRWRHPRKLTDARRPHPPAALAGVARDAPALGGVAYRARCTQGRHARNLAAAGCEDRRRVARRGTGAARRQGCR